MWSQNLCFSEEGCDTYSRGNSECIIGPKGFGSNVCFFSELPERWYCPASVPLAVLAPSKVGSTSNVDWLAQMDFIANMSFLFQNPAFMSLKINSFEDVYFRLGLLMHRA